MSSSEFEQAVPSLSVSNTASNILPSDHEQEISNISVPTIPSNQYVSLSSNGRPKAEWGFAYPLKTDDFFGLLPIEVLEMIFIRSENLDMMFVNRQFHASCGSELVRLRFCAHVFYHGRERNKPPIPRCPSKKCTPIRTFRTHMGMLQTRILRQKWFTADFAKRVEGMVTRLRKVD